MSAAVLFLIVLLIGVLITYMGSKAKGKSKAISIIIGVIVVIVGGYGLFAALI